MTSSNQPPQANIIDWAAAGKIAAALAPAGPKLSKSARLNQKKMNAAVESMRYAALESVDYVYEITGLEAAKNLRDSEVLIVDRATWAKANTQSFGVMLDPVGESVMGKKFAELTEAQKAVTRYAGAAELGGVLAFMATRVLGQYEPYAALAGHGAAGGRLMIVAPNLLSVERELNLDPQDFRLWVCLHEQTHRVQFAAAPWLRNYMLDLMQQMATSLGSTTDNLWSRVLDSAVSVKDSMQKGRAGREKGSLLLNAEAKETMSRITAVMSLLEGHANVVMDAVDSSIVPTVKTIRQRFNRRSESQKFLTKLAFKLLGMERKMRQYKDGQKFVQFIVDAEGMERFNRIWESPETLPTEAEIHNPQAWIDRVLKDGAHADRA